MIHKYLVQVELTPEQAALISPEVLRLDIRRAVQTLLAMTLNDPPTVTVVRDEVPGDTVTVTLKRRFPLIISRQCPVCHGFGKVNAAESSGGYSAVVCIRCQGSGFVPK